MEASSTAAATKRDATGRVGNYKFISCADVDGYLLDDIILPRYDFSRKECQAGALRLQRPNRAPQRLAQFRQRARTPCRRA